MSPSKTNIVFVLDRSGSMETIKSDVIGGFKSFIEKQKKVEGECRISLMTFNTTPNWEYKNYDIKVVPGLEFEPSGCTALYDALGKALESYSTHCKECCSKVLFVIFTDGLENASKKYTRSQIFEMIDHKKKTHGWDFVYLGANQDAFSEGGKINIDSGWTHTYHPKQTRKTWNIIGDSVSIYRTSRNDLTNFFDNQPLKATN